MASGLATAAGKSCQSVGLIGRILQFIIWVLVATWVGRKLFGWLMRGAVRQSAQRPQQQRTPWPQQQQSTAGAAEPARRQLHRDPMCGTHVPAGISFTWEESGHTHHFCSAECRERYAVQHPRQRRTASA